MDSRVRGNDVVVPANIIHFHSTCAIIEQQSHSAQNALTQARGG
jgi:hypothetical protein